MNFPIQKILLLSLLLLTLSMTCNRQGGSPLAFRDCLNIYGSQHAADVQSDINADPCYWCMETKYIGAFRPCTDCSEDCPCPGYPQINQHKFGGIIVDNAQSGRTNMFQGNVSSCYDSQPNATLDLPFTFRIGFDCATVSSRSGKIATIRSYITENGSPLAGTATSISRDIMVPDLKTDYCDASGTTCATSFAGEHSFKFLDGNTYHQVLEIDHDHPTNAHTGPTSSNHAIVHPHTQTVPIRLCGVGQQPVKKDINTQF